MVGVVKMGDLSHLLHLCMCVPLPFPTSEQALPSPKKRQWHYCSPIDLSSLTDSDNEIKEALNMI